MTSAQKEFIDNLDYESMLYLWRMAPVGHLLLQGDTGEYFSKVLKMKRKNISDAEHTITSKRIGWQN